MVRGVHYLLCVWLLGAVLTGIHRPTAAADGFAVDIAPGAFDEHCLRLAAGATIRWRFLAAGPVDFNIHYHRGKEVFYPVRREGAERASGRFRAGIADDYCLMWTNRSTAKVRVHGEIRHQP